MTKTYKRRIILILCVLLSIFFCGISFLITDSKKVYASEAPAATATVSFADKLSYVTYPEQSDTYFCLADKYMFMIEDQDSLGLCWDFSGLTVIENYLAVTTGELYDFSEAWISLCKKVDNSNYTIGDGGAFVDVINAINSYGLFFEDEFPTEILYNVDESNYQDIFNLYKKKAHKDIISNLNYASFMIFPVESRVEYIKKYLTNYGALNISYDDENRIERNGLNVVCSNTYNSNTKGAHAVTLIGWDDNLTFMDKENKEHTGAYICLNSWGTNTDVEVVYIAYDDFWTMSTIYGIVYNANNLDLEITETSSQINNYNINKYNPHNEPIDTGVYEEKNVWFYGEEVSLKYNSLYNGGYNSSNTKLVGATVKKDNIEINSQLDLFDLQPQSLKIIDDDMDSGNYYIYFDFDIDGDNVSDKTVIKKFTILSGTETARVYAQGDSLIINQNLNKIVSTKNENVLYGYTTTGQVNFVFNFSNFAKMKKAEVCSGVSSSYYSGFNTATSISYTKGAYVLTVDVDTQKGLIEKTVRFVLVDGNKVTYKLVVYSMTSNDRRAFVFYNYADGDNIVSKSSDMYDYIAVGTSFDNTLGSPTNSNISRRLDYWCSDRALKNKITVLNASLKQCTGAHYYHDSTKYYVFVYAKWKDVDVNVAFDDETTTLVYGDAINFSFQPASSGSGQFDYTIISSQFSGNLQFSLTDFSVVANGTVNVGSYTIKIQVLDTQMNKTAVATKKLIVTKRPITYQIDNKQSEYGEAIAELTGRVVLGTVVGDDDLNITFLCDVSDNSPVGEYEISGISRNNNYSVTFISAVYDVIGATIRCDVQSYDGVFDNSPHTISIENVNCSGYQVMYKLEGGEYSTTPITFTNATNGQVTIYFKITADGYGALEGQGYVDITKKSISLNWSNLNVSYNGQEQLPVVSTSDDTFGINLQFNLGTGYVNANTYLVQALLDNDNFEISNPSKDFIISKARPNISQDDISFTSQQLNAAKQLKDIILPNGYSWKNPNQELVEGENICLLTYTPSDVINYSVIDNIELKITKKAELPNYTLVLVIIALSTLVLSVIVSSVFKLQRYAYEKRILDKPSNVKVQKPKGESVVIMFVTNSPIHIEPVQTYKRLTIKLPEPQRNYYKFCGWYTDKLFLNPYTSNGVENVLTLYAKWEPKVK